jgi:hypothetical protein
MPTTLASKPRTGIYPIDGGFLFVPTEDMWNVHEASKPSSVSERAGLGRADRWIENHSERWPWLVDWLYWSCEIPAEADGFEPTDAMLAFRKQATIRAILAGAPRCEERMQEAWRQDYRPHITEALLSYWRRLYKKYDWYDRWLLRGEHAPAGVTAVTAQQARRCSRAWDFATFCRRIGVRSDATYVLWLSRRQVPNLGWLKWLFGAPAPAGAFVVGSELQRLRHEMGRKAILKAVGLSSATIWCWEKGQRTSEAIKAILSGGDGEDAEGWGQLNPDTRRHMEDVGKAASLAACCTRAGFDASRYYSALKEAERCGVKGELLQYLRLEGRYTTAKARQSGLVADNFFIPTKDMLRFRAEAIGEAAKQKVWSLHGLPGLDDWFRDWTSPKSYRGKRHILALSEDTLPPVVQEHQNTPDQAQQNAPDQPPRKRGRPKGTIDEGRVKRIRLMLEAWDRGEFGGNKAQAGRMYGFHRPAATVIINAHEKKKRQAGR